MSPTLLSNSPAHPAKYSTPLLPVIARALDDSISGLHESLEGPYRIYDPFGGVGGVHRLRTELEDWWGDRIQLFAGELEFNWAKQCQDEPMVQADALMSPFADGTFDAVVTSPCYGNRMADSHEARDACSECQGWGCGVSDPLGSVQCPFTSEYVLKTGTLNPWAAPGAVHRQHVADCRNCKKCGGKGLSKRNTYTHQYGEKLRPESAAVMQWGVQYRNFHTEAWQEVWRLLREHGTFVMNISDHIRDKQVVEVTKWHHDVILETGFTLQDHIKVNTKRQKQGSNGDARVDYESVLVYTKEAA